jgi:photosystem II stability/assembly factor-like uncharacterized protein
MQATAAPATDAPAAGVGQWVVISDEFTAKLTDEANKNRKPDQKPETDQKTAGIVVDRTTGDVYMIANAKGVAKSSDGGKTWELVSGKTINGRCETGFALNMDPAGKRLMCFMIYGVAGRTDDAGKTWEASKKSHLDFGAVDWEGTGKDMLAIGHESGGTLLFTTDAGKAWKELGKGYSGPLGVFDDKTLVAAKGLKLSRSTDGGATWAEVAKGIPAEVKAAGQVAYTFKGKSYVVTDKGLLVSSDKGATWETQGAPVNAAIGPFFGKDENSLVVVGKDGIFQTADGGKKWDKIAPLAPFGLKGAGPNYAWDPISNTLYASIMFQPAYKYEVKK